jgi:hypothetical protein
VLASGSCTALARGEASVVGIADTASAFEAIFFGGGGVVPFLMRSLGLAPGTGGGGRGGRLSACASRPHFLVWQLPSVRAKRPRWAGCGNRRGLVGLRNGAGFERVLSFSPLRATTVRQ